MKISTNVQTILLSVFSTMIVSAAVFAITTVLAAPTQAPPGGNPTFPLTGPSGPAGPQGPQGPSGSGATLNCVTQAQSFTTSTTQVSVSCGSGYTATGGGFYLSDGGNNGLNWNDAWAYPDGSTTWTCGRNVYGGPQYSTCFVRCCRIQ